MDEEEPSWDLCSGTSTQRWIQELKTCPEVVLIRPPISTADFLCCLLSRARRGCTCLCARPHHGVVTLWQIGPNSNAMRHAALQLESTNETGHNSVRWARLELNILSPLKQFRPSLNINKHIFTSKLLPHYLVLMQYASAAVPISKGLLFSGLL